MKILFSWGKMVLVKKLFVIIECFQLEGLEYNYNKKPSEGVKPTEGSKKHFVRTT